MSNLFKIYSVRKYNIAKKDFEKYAKTFTSPDAMANELEKEDEFYHFRVLPNKEYIVFGDIDNAVCGIEHIREIIKVFFNTYYNLDFTIEEFKYTINNGKQGSYHFAIPKWKASTNKIKSIVQELIDTYPNEFIVSNGGRESRILDTSIYSEHWFRCPYQSKGSGEKNSVHEVVEGETVDFIIDNIPEYSISINNISKIRDLPTAIQTIENNTNNISIPEPIQHLNVNIPNALPTPPSYSSITIPDGENLLSFAMTKPKLYEKLFDDCYKPFRFSDYNEWVKVGMAILNTIPNYNDALRLFIYFSEKAPNYSGEIETTRKFESFKNMNKIGYGVKTLYKIAYQDNKEQARLILNRNTIEFNPTDIARFLKLLGGHHYFYKVNNDKDYMLYCYNGRYWVNNPILLKTFITTELFAFLKELLTDVYWNLNNRDFSILKSKIDKLTTSRGKDEIIETYKEYNARNDIQFDTKWWLFGFNNKVYDLKEHQFRDYELEDYITITCGYDWREPTLKERVILNNIINKIMPNKEDKETLLQILSTGLDGKNLEKFNIFSGCGRNGKGLIDDLALKTIGRYGMIANSSILFETPRTGSNPEKANMHKKRLCIFREPPKNRKFENAIIKEITGGGKFSARSHYDNNTEKELNCTVICECNEKPIFQEPLLNADIERLIDVEFTSIFTKEQSKVDIANNIYLGNDNYKTSEFQEQHKYAFFKMLIDNYRKYQTNNNTIIKSNNVCASTKKYIENASDIVNWFKENYVRDVEEDQFIKISDIHRHLLDSEYYRKLSKVEKDNFGKIKFIKLVSTNPFFRNYYYPRIGDDKNLIKGWHLRINDDEEYDLE